MSAVLVVRQLAVRNTADTAVAQETRYTAFLMNIGTVNSKRKLETTESRF